VPLKGQCHKIFDLRLFHESVSPKPLSIPLRTLRIFRKFAEIFAAQGAPPVSLTLASNFPSISWTPVANLPPVSTAVPGGKICRRCRWCWWCTLTDEYLRKFSKKMEVTLMLFSGAWEDDSWKKPEAKNLVTMSQCRHPGTGIWTYKATVIALWHFL
jgi:hypothetical protein